MKKFVLVLVCICMVLGWACAAETETIIQISDDQIAVNGQAIGTETDAAVYLNHRTEMHEDVPDALAGLENRVITITSGGTYRFSGKAQDAQIRVEAGDADRVRIILDGVNITCRTAPAIAVVSAHDPRVAGEYAVTIELASGSENMVSGSHTEETEEEDIKLSGAISSLVSLGFAGEGKLRVDADNEGIEVKFGHMTFDGGNFHIEAGDDPLNVSEDGVGVLTVNGGYLYSAVKPEAGGEGDGVDSNGRIVINGGTVINLAHPDSMDSGIDSDMGSSINGGVVVGAGNMYDAIEADSGQIFMMLEFAQECDELVVVTDTDGQPVFAYDFPHSYTYIAFSTPELEEGVYHVYLGGEIVGEQQDGLYSRIDSYVPGVQMQHGGSGAQRGMNLPEGMQMPENMQVPPEGMGRPDDMQMPPDFENMPEMPGLQMPDDMQDFRGKGGRGFGGSFGGGFGGPRGMESSAETSTADFALSRNSTGFTNVNAG